MKRVFKMLNTEVLGQRWKPAQDAAKRTQIAAKRAQVEKWRTTPTWVRYDCFSLSFLYHFFGGLCRYLRSGSVPSMLAPDTSTFGSGLSGYTERRPRGRGRRGPGVWNEGSYVM